MKSKILFLLHLPPPIHGSSVVGKQLLNSTKIHLIFETKFLNLLASKTVKDTGKISFNKLGLFFKTLGRLLAELIFDKSDLCYYALSTTGYAFYRDAFLVIIIKLFQVPIVFHLHNKGVQKNSNHWITKYFYQLVFNNTDVILLSESLYTDIQTFVPRNRIYICPNGVVIESEIEYNKKTLPCILFLSNFIQSKGVLDLIQACQILKNRSVQFQLILIGNEGDLTIEDLESVISEKELRMQCQILGPQYGDFKKSALSNTSLFVFPTYYECFPLVLLEAMQARLPIISTFEGGIPDIVIDGVTGFLVQQRDVYTLADRMEQLILSPELCEQMGSAGRQRYEALFTAEIFENRIIDILQVITQKYA